LELKLFLGKPCEEVNKDISDNFGLSPDSLCIYLTLKVTNSELAKNKFEEIINSLLAMI
jgi:hypothetical protein